MTEKEYKMELFVDDKITVFAGIPTMVDAILSNKRIKSSDLKQLRYFILGGAKTDEKTKENVLEFGRQHGCDLKLVDGLGQTEVSTAYLYNNVLSINDRVKIVNPETNEELTYGEVGEICVRGTSFIIRKGTEIPCENSQEFFTSQDNQKGIECVTLLGESLSPNENQILGKIMLNDMPLLPQGQGKMIVTFNISKDKVLHVIAKNAHTGTVVEAYYFLNGII